MLDALLHLANDMAVIHVGWYNHIPTSAVLPQVDTWLTAHFPEANLLHHLNELEVPLPASLLEAIKRLEEQAIEQVPISGVLLIALRWFHVDLLQVTIQESSGNVNGVTFEVICSNKCEESMHNRELDGGCKGLDIVPPRSLREPLGNQTGL